MRVIWCLCVRGNVGIVAAVRFSTHRFCLKAVTGHRDTCNTQLGYSAQQHVHELTGTTSSAAFPKHQGYCLADCFDLPFLRIRAACPRHQSHCTNTRQCYLQLSAEDSIGLERCCVQTACCTARVELSNTLHVLYYFTVASKEALPITKVQNCNVYADAYFRFTELQVDNDLQSCF
jgi:hypothetical protein